MADVLVEESSLEELGDAIRTVNRSDNTYLPEEMPQAVLDLANTNFEKQIFLDVIARASTCDEVLNLENATEIESKELDEEALRMRHLLLTKLSDMGLSVRAFNCLKAADIDTFADLVSYSRAELMKFRNFGRKSLNEIDLLVEKMKLSFGMDVTKYNIEPKKKNV